MFQLKACNGKEPVVGDSKMWEEERRTGESRKSAGLRPAGIEK